MHLPVHNITVPGTKLYTKLNSDGTLNKWSIPINRVDNAANHHDLYFSKNNDNKTRNRICDRTMLNELNEIVNPTSREGIVKSIAGKLIHAKVNFELVALRKQKIPIFTDELAEELYKPVTRKFQRRVNVNGIDEIWAADLIYMQAFAKDNNGIKYWLTIIDIFSKFL